MKQSSPLLWVTTVALLALMHPLLAAQDSALAGKKAAAGGSAQPDGRDNSAAAPLEQAGNAAVVAPGVQQASASASGPGIQEMRMEAARLKAEAKTLRDLADTLNRSSDDAEKRADEAQQKAEKLQEEIGESDVEHAANHVRVEIERIKRLVQADVERIKKVHGVKTADDSLYAHQADSLEGVLARVSSDTSQTMDKQKRLVQEIQANSNELLQKSREMSTKARELEEAADKREDLAEDLSEKADRLSEEQNPVALSKRFPLHFGFQVRACDVGPYNQQKLDVLLLQGLFLAYSFTKNFDAGLQDIMVYWQETLYGQRYAVTASPSARLAFFPVKRLQLGAVGGVSVQGLVGADRSARVSAAPFITLFNEVWVRNHFSISPLVRFSYAAYGPYYTTALSQHSGVLPQGAVWMDFGIGYAFNF